MAWIGSASERPRADAFGRDRPLSQEATRSFLGRVHRFMALGLGVTGLVALLIASSPALVLTIATNRPLFFGLIIAELLMVVAFSPIAARVSASVAALLFVAYAALSGVTFSVIFLVYTSGSIATTFFITAGMFAGLSAYGALTKRSLDSVGSFAMMGLIGLVIASIVNIFLASPMLYWLTTFVGVIVFTALTAYDTAKLKALGGVASGREEETKLALQGALILYLDFINLFLLLLRLFGRRRD